MAEVTFDDQLNARIEEYRRLCMAHDVHYEHSDDHRAWEKGKKQYEAIRKAREGLPRDVWVAIWNECMKARGYRDDVMITHTNQQEAGK